MKTTVTANRPQLASLDFGTNRGLFGILNTLINLLTNLIVPLINLITGLFGGTPE